MKISIAVIGPYDANLRNANITVKQGKNRCNITLKMKYQNDNEILLVGQIAIHLMHKLNFGIQVDSIKRDFLKLMCRNYLLNKKTILFQHVFLIFKKCKALNFILFFTWYHFLIFQGEY